MTERPFPEGWTQRDRLLPIGGFSDLVLCSACDAFADEVDGYDSCDPATEAKYEALLFSYDNATWRKAAADQLYSCALTGLALLDCFGAETPGTDTPYRPRMGQAVGAVKQAGKDLGGWTTAGDPHANPSIILVGDNTAAHGAEHVIIWTGSQWVEGGQVSERGKGYRISKAVYQTTPRADGFWMRRSSPNPNSWRKVMGWIDLTLCLWTQRATLPEGA